MEYTENLDRYEKLNNTESCYLDGRYFNKVFIRYPGLLAEPLYITIRETKIKTPSKEEKSLKYYVSMKESNINTNYTGILRLVIQTSKTKHSNLLILDYTNGKVYRFEPLGENAPYYEEVNNIITQYLGIFFDVDLEVIDIEIDEILNEKNEKNPNCKKSGFCVAYIILYAYVFLNQKDFDPTDILKFARLVEETYGSLPREYPEIEYGYHDRDHNHRQGNDDGRTGKLLAGGTIGGLVGGLAFGSPIGIVAGGLGGLAIGSAI